jgi:hypothetical protein
MKKIVLVMILVLFASVSFAADRSAGVYTVKALRVSDTTGFTYVETVEEIEVKNESCSQSDMFAISGDAESYQQMYSALLTAGVSGKNIQVWVSIDADDCLNSRQRISVVQVLLQ